jgi:hypothetical protein
MAAEDAVRVFVGTDRSQLLGAKILDYSIRRRTNLNVVTRPMHDLVLPQPNDPRNRSRTGFSFARFAIPELAGRKGRAIYMDADMLVFKDVAELWNFPFKGAKVVCQEEPPRRATMGRPRARLKQCSVMLLDCERLDWDVNAIVAGLDGRYDYSQLMDELCIVEESEVSYDLPTRWNSLEHWDENTALIHYTDMLTQPWVCARNPNGYLWVDELRQAMVDRVASTAEAEEEIAQGFARPSLAEELAGPSGPRAAAAIARYESIDRAAGFKPHAALVSTLDSRAGGRLAAAARRALSGVKRALAGA